eukprot:5420386-Amphidinium_carterae.1
MTVHGVGSVTSGCLIKGTATSTTQDSRSFRLTINGVQYTVPQTKLKGTKSVSVGTEYFLIGVPDT